ncbi:MAG: hypothetical protein AB8C84_03055 [Oligoflexales bacterium]
MLFDSGYARVGREMVPMAQISSDFQSQETLAGVCVHKNCYPGEAPK